MNFYIVVEGEKTEKMIYNKWIKYINPELKSVNDPNDVINNNFLIYGGFGYPFYLQMIDDSIKDVNDHGNIDRLVIAVDSEDMTYDEKYSEIQTHIDGKDCDAEIHIIIQHFCIETWALGNQILIKRNPQNKLLKKYLQIFNVIDNDPELMPSFRNYTRAQFAYKYLQKAVNERYRNLSYSKGNPNVLLNRKYFERVKKRCSKYDHIRSFYNFLKTFSIGKSQKFI